MGRSRWSLLMHPVFTGSVALLALNDQVLKARYPGLITGKLSDVAGVAAVAVVIYVITGRHRAALAVTAVAFAALKLVPAVAIAAGPFLGGVTRTDATDLSALAVLWPLGRWLTRIQPRMNTGRWSVPLLPVMMTVLAGTTATATSCDYPSHVDRLVVQPDALWAGISLQGYADDDPVVHWAVSYDTGQTWERAPSDRGPEGGSGGGVERCGPSGTCWRVRADQRVERREGTEWTTAFEFTKALRRRADGRTGACANPMDRTFEQVAVIPGATEIVVVAMGSEGILRFDGTDWARIGVLYLDPTPLDGPYELMVAARLAPLALLVTGLGFWATSRPGSRWRPRHRWNRAAANTAIAGGVLLFVNGFFWPPFVAAKYFGPVIVALTLGAFGYSGFVLVRPVRPLPPPDAAHIPPPPRRPGQPPPPPWVPPRSRGPK